MEKGRETERVCERGRSNRQKVINRWIETVSNMERKKKRAG